MWDLDQEHMFKAMLDVLYFQPTPMRSMSMSSTYYVRLAHSRHSPSWIDL
jgi:hypothetical protein